ncbi:MAG: ABC transporter permease [Christensenella sp.]|nr:ABC transporter permease [Christensenella sp.]
MKAESSTIEAININESQSKSNTFYQSFKPFIPSVAAIVILVVLGQVLSNGFASVGNMGSVLSQASLLAMVAIGQSMVIFSGDFSIDLSAGAVMSMGALIGSMVSVGEDIMIIPAILVLVGLGALIGFINGICVQKIKIPALAMTLVMATVVNGFTFLYTRGQPAVMVPPLLMGVGRPIVGVIRPLLIIAVIAIVAMEFVMRRSRYGKSLYLVGNNRKAAALCGIHVDRTVVIAFMLCSIFSCIAGLLLVGYTGSGQLKMGEEYTMLSIAAVVIGGARVAGGKGTLIGAFLGSVVMILLTSVLTAVGMAEGTRTFLQGVLLVLILMIQCRSPKLRQ